MFGVVGGGGMLSVSSCIGWDSTCSAHSYSYVRHKLRFFCEAQVLLNAWVSMSAAVLISCAPGNHWV